MATIPSSEMNNYKGKYNTCVCACIKESCRHVKDSVLRVIVRWIMETHRYRMHIRVNIYCIGAPQWGAADAEIKVPSDENTELKSSPFKVWSRSVYSHTCYAYCQEFLPRLFLPFRSIHLHLFQNLSQFFSCVGCG